MSAATQRAAIVAVSVASTPALIPEPRPSDSTEMTRPSSHLIDWNASPGALCPRLDTW